MSTSIDAPETEVPRHPDSAAPPMPTTPMAQPNTRFMLSHPAHFIALGFGSGLSRIAPGTSGTLWAWVAFVVLQPWMSDTAWAITIGLAVPLGWWASTVTARNMGVLDPSSVVWDEIAAFWLVLWLVMPTDLTGQVMAFGLFRFFDAVKPGPVGWADTLFHAISPATDRFAWHKAGLGIMLDDLVAAGCTLMVIAVWRFYA